MLFSKLYRPHRKTTGFFKSFPTQAKPFSSRCGFFSWIDTFPRGRLVYLVPSPGVPSHALKSRGSGITIQKPSSRLFCFIKSLRGSANFFYLSSPFKPTLKNNKEILSKNRNTMEPENIDVCTTLNPCTNFQSRKHKPTTRVSNLHHSLLPIINSTALFASG